MDVDHPFGDTEEDDQYYEAAIDDIDEDQIDDEDDGGDVEFTIDASDLAAAMEQANGGQHEDGESTTLRDILNAMAELHNLHAQNTTRPANATQDTPSTRATISGLTIEDLRRIFDGTSPSVQVDSNQGDNNNDDEDDDDEDDDEDYHPDDRDWDRSRGWFEPVKKPKEDGMTLLMSGEYGRLKHQLDSREKKTNIAKILLNRGERTRPMYREDLTSDILPNSSGTAVVRYESNAYVGQYSSDSAFYYTCVRDFRLHVYDTSAPLNPHTPTRSRVRDEYGYGHDTTMKVMKTIPAQPGRWTITDSHLSPDNQRIIYANISNTIYMATTVDSSPVQHAICFADPARTGSGRSYMGWDEDHFGLWSCKFSADGNEVIAGGQCFIFVYDLLGNRRTVKIRAHEDDVNSCCWADTASGNVLVSASDDTFLKVWDRRSLGTSQKPSGVLIGHTEGITYVSAKGDGRYVISNGKDQVLRLWDLRKMRSSLEHEQSERRYYGIPNFDYRSGFYPRPRHKAHPLDCSVMQYTGHEVLRTLIRCHFSPVQTTGQQYIYSGASDGRIHIWSLDGRVVQVLDRSETLPMSFDPTGPDPPSKPRSNLKVCVRDVSWHSQLPILMSAGWLGSRWSSREGSVIARHEWKGLSKTRGAVEDWVEKHKSERAERAARRSMTRGVTMPGAFGVESGDEDEDDD